VNAADLAVVGGAAGVGAVVGALVAHTHVSLVGRRWPVLCAVPSPVPAAAAWPRVEIPASGGAAVAGGRVVVRLVGRPYDWARDGEARPA
jgi:hypothetical protein